MLHSKPPSPLDDAIAILREIQFGQSGYIFGYDSKGTRLLLGKATNGLGDNFMNMQDTQGNYLIQDLLKNAKLNQFTTYYFPKPGEQTPLPKLSYSVYLPQWDLTIGTGFTLTMSMLKLQRWKRAQKSSSNKGYIHWLALHCLLSFWLA